MELAVSGLMVFSAGGQGSPRSLVSAVMAPLDVAAGMFGVGALLLISLLWLSTALMTGGKQSPAGEEHVGRKGGQSGEDRGRDCPNGTLYTAQSLEVSLDKKYGVSQFFRSRSGLREISSTDSHIAMEGDTTSRWAPIKCYNAPTRDHSATP